MDRNPALTTIKECGLWRLAAFDGCPCCGFEIHSIHVDVSCRKSGANTHSDGGVTIRVYSHHIDLENAHDILREVGDEVARQVAEYTGLDYPEGFNIVFEEYR